MSIALNPEQALARARNWCAIQERSHNETRLKLYQWGLKAREVEKIIAELISSGFINEERFARQFAGGKFRIKKWGRIKILSHLKQKNISEYCINKGISEISEKDYKETLKTLLLKKDKTLKERNPLLKKNKLARFLMAKGFEGELVWEVLRDFNPK